MTYHAIHNVDISHDFAGADTATLTARSRTHATIWGAEGTWPLQLRIRFLRTANSWLAADTVASTW